MEEALPSPAPHSLAVLTSGPTAGLNSWASWSVWGHQWPGFWAWVNSLSLLTISDGHCHLVP